MRLVKNHFLLFLGLKGGDDFMGLWDLQLALQLLVVVVSVGV